MRTKTTMITKKHARRSRPDAARRLYAALVEQWKDGDSDHVLLKTARERLARLAPAAASVSK
jgi:hypothetical protein